MYFGIFSTDGSDDVRRKPCHVSSGKERFVVCLMLVSFNEVFDYARKNCSCVAFVNIVFVLNSKVLFTYAYYTVERQWWSSISHRWLLNMWFKTGDTIVKCHGDSMSGMWNQVLSKNVGMCGTVLTIPPNIGKWRLRPCGLKNELGCR
jgi:hypothetical protein